jgi:two-component system chemotaxis sensor kinase CheA
VVLTAGVSGDEVFVSVSDDGQGLDWERIFALAYERGLTEGRGIEAYERKEIYRFIMMPGFSTNSRVTEFSGRGVGLDVVANNVASIGGRVEVDSVLGQWTEVCIWVPLG